MIQSAQPRCVRDTVSHHEHAHALVPKHAHRRIAIHATCVAHVQHVVGDSMGMHVLQIKLPPWLSDMLQTLPLHRNVVRQGLMAEHTEESVFLHARGQSSHCIAKT